MSQYFRKPHERCGRNVKGELDLTKYATKSELKGATGNDSSRLAAKSDLTSLKTQVDKIYADELKALPADLSKLSTVGDNDVVKKLCLINWLQILILLIPIYQVLVD